MKFLKEQETTKKHKKEVEDNLRDKVIHIGNLKNIAPGDKIYVYHGFYETLFNYAEVYMIDRENEALYISFRNKIKRFHMFNCREWEIDHKKPAEEGTTMRENFLLADNKSPSLIKYPIISVK